MYVCMYDLEILQQIRAHRDTLVPQVALFGSLTWLEIAADMIGQCRTLVAKLCDTHRTLLTVSTIERSSVTVLKCLQEARYATIRCESNPDPNWMAAEDYFRALRLCDAISDECRIGIWQCWQIWNSSDTAVVDLAEALRHELLLYHRCSQVTACDMIDWHGQQTPTLRKAQGDYTTQASAENCVLYEADATFPTIHHHHHIPPPHTQYTDTLNRSILCAHFMARKWPTDAMHWSIDETMQWFDQRYGNASHRIMEPAHAIVHDPPSQATNMQHLWMPIHSLESPLTRANGSQATSTHAARLMLSHAQRTHPARRDLAPNLHAHNITLTPMHGRWHTRIRLAADRHKDINAWMLQATTTQDVRTFLARIHPQWRNYRICTRSSDLQPDESLYETKELIRQWIDPPSRYPSG